MTEPTAAPGPGSGYQWRIVIDGDPGRRPPHIGCWIDVVDGDFQNLNVVGRLEFRAKPCATSRRPTFAPRNEDAGGPPGVIDLPTVRALIERAREDALDGLTACHLLAGVAEQMAGEIEQLQAELDRIRALHPAATINPAVHTPARVLAYLHRLSWVREGGGRVVELWHPVGEPDKRVIVPLIATAPDYAKVLRFLVSDLARVQGVGEDGVLAGIEAEDA